MIPSEAIRRGIIVGLEVVFYMILTLTIAALVTGLGIAANHYIFGVAAA